MGNENKKLLPESLTYNKEASLLLDYESVNEMPKINDYKAGRDTLTRSEVEAMIAKAPDLKTKAFVSFLYIFGCRINEALKIRRKDINIEHDKLVTIRLAYSKKKKKGEQQVLSDIHEIPVSVKTPFIDNLLQYYYNMPKEEDRLLWDWDRVRAWKIITSLDHNTWLHLFRHTRMTNLAREGATEAELMMWAGWADSRPVGRYVRRSGELLKRLTEKVK